MIFKFSIFLYKNDGYIKKRSKSLTIGRTFYLFLPLFYQCFIKTVRQSVNKYGSFILPEPDIIIVWDPRVKTGRRAKPPPKLAPT